MAALLPARNGPGRSRWRRRLAVGGVVLVAVVAALLRHRPAPEPTPGRALLSTGGPAGWWWRQAMSSLGVPPRVLAASAPASAGTIDVCGVPGGVSPGDAQGLADLPVVADPAASAAEPAASDAPPPLPTFPTAWPPATPAERRILDALQQSPDATSHAAALLLGPSGEPDDPLGRLERLAAAARRTTDPGLYALAYRSCQAFRAPQRPASCPFLSTAQWARLDADNGLPWLYALDEAVRGGDTAARDEALFQLAAAGRFDDRFFDLSAAVAERIPAGDDAATLAGWMLAVRAVAATGDSPPYGALLAQCRGREVADGNRRQLCAVVADRFIDHGKSALAQSIGGAIDRSVTGSAARADRLRAEREAVLRGPSPDDFSCSGLRRDLRRMQQAAQIGEMAAWRESRPQAQPVPAVQ